MNDEKKFLSALTTKGSARRAGRLQPGYDGFAVKLRISDAQFDYTSQETFALVHPPTKAEEGFDFDHA